MVTSSASIKVPTEALEQGEAVGYASPTLGKNVVIALP